MAEDARELRQYIVWALEPMARIFPDQWYNLHDLIKDNIITLEQLQGENQGINWPKSEQSLSNPVLNGG